jgi:hypothetical protein
MALAVEGSAAVMIGVSRAYKESSNCRMEAQYALQKKKPLIPLMLAQGYEADGWLGLLLGTSMWYGFYGDALSSASTFDARMDALCREIGSRGRADAVMHTGASLASGVASDADDTPLAKELRAMTGSTLRKRAISSGVSDAALEAADDAADTRTEVVKLILAQELPADQTGRPVLHSVDDSRRDELLASKTSTLRKRAVAAGVTAAAMETADDAADTKAALVELILAMPTG